MLEDRENLLTYTLYFLIVRKRLGDWDGTCAYDDESWLEV